MKSLFVFLLIVLSAKLLPQELNCRVNLSFENLPTVNKNILENLGREIEDYMNKTRFTGGSWEGEKIECSFNIFMTYASSETNYSAQIVVTSQRPVYKSTKNSLMLLINDNAWNFTYEKNQPLYSNPSAFDPLTSLLDFYAFIIIGTDMDSWEQMGGTAYFSKASDIVNLGATSRYSTGWEKNTKAYSRRGFVENVLSEKYRQFREAFYDYHYNGIDLYSQNPRKAQERIVKLINTLDAMRNKIELSSVLIRTFFDTKSGEIVEYLKTYPDKEIFRVLKKIDPAHASKYDESLN